MSSTRSAAPHSQARSLGMCLGLALGLHAVLLAWPHAPQGGRHGGPATAMEVRLLSVVPSAAVQPVAELAKAAPETRPVVERPAALPQLELGSSSHEDAQAPQLSSPDAALPGGRAQARVWLAVEADGYVRELRVEPEVLPRAFERAIERAFAGSRVPLEPASRRGGSVCVEVEFKDGESPSWQAIKPAGVCLA